MSGDNLLLLIALGWLIVLWIVMDRDPVNPNKRGGR